MPVLDPKFFTGAQELPPDLAEKLLAKDLHADVGAVLTKIGWEGQLISAFGLNLSPDGTLVQSANFLLRGALATTPITVKANTVWDKVAKGVSINIALPDSSAFSFSGGELVSDYLSHEKVKYTVTKDGNTIPLAEWSTNNVGNFALRIIAYLDKSSNTRSGPHFRVTVLLYPLSVEELEELSEATQSVSWPGVKILEGRAELFPRAPVDFWGCPVLPILNREHRSENCTTIPPSCNLRHAISELARSAALPNACKTRVGLKKQMDEMMRDPANLEPRLPTVMWPAAPRPQTEQGKHTILLK